MTDTLDEVFRREAGRCTATLIRVLGEVDVAEDTDQGGGAAAGFAPEDLVERVGHPCAGRTSTGPSQAAAALPAHSRAASRSVASMTQKPPICSLVSA